MSIDADEPVHILLVGPPASAKTMFIKSLMKLNNSYFTDGGNSTKAGMLEYIFDNQPKYLLIDEIDKMSTKDQTFLLNLMETGIVTETKHRKTRTATNVKTWVFASFLERRRHSSFSCSSILLIDFSLLKVLFLTLSSSEQ